jgi:hypothetical protein
MLDNAFAEGKHVSWASRRMELAAWTWRWLVNRVDVWGGYWQDESTEGSPTRRTTWPHPRDRGKYFLTEQILANHFAATDTRFVVGLHTTSPENSSRWAAADLDCHGPSSTPAHVNLAGAIHWFGQLQSLGFHPLLSDSNGAGGYHLLVIFREPVPTAKTFTFMQWLVRDHAAQGIPTAPEVFPKQAGLKPGGYGNWLRLPGRHHTREHWSRVWDGVSWLEAHAAIDKILSLDGDAHELIPAAALAPKVTISIRTAPRRRALHARADKLAARVRGYLAKLPAGLGEGQHRDDYGFRFAAFLVRDLGLSDAEALSWLEQWDMRNAIPKGPDCLIKLLASAHAYGRHTYASGLNSRRT